VYFVEVGKWYPFGPGGLPDGIDYELQVSIEAHKVDSFVFAPEAVLEKELENNSLLSPQNIDSLLNYFTFFDATVGNTDYPASSGSSRDVNFLTPTARVRGSGDGSFDVYSFEITPDMLASEGVSIDVGTGDSVVDPNGPFFKEMDLVLNGTVKAGDVWTLGLRYPFLRRRYRSGRSRPADRRADARGGGPRAAACALGALQGLDRRQSGHRRGRDRPASK
jgi:hypothetical protein